MKLALLLLQSDNLADWWDSFYRGETYARDWVGFFLVLGIGGALCYGVYRTLLANIIRANYHPANFRKVMWACFFAICIAGFGWVFSNAFGIYFIATLVGLWLLMVVIFAFSRRQVH